MRDKTVGARSQIDGRISLTREAPSNPRVGEVRAAKTGSRPRTVLGSANQSKTLNAVLMPDGSYVTAVSPKVVERAARVANISLHRVLGELNIVIGKSRGSRD